MITNWKMAVNLMMREALMMKVKNPGEGDLLWRQIMTGKLDKDAKYTGTEKYRFLTPRQKKLAETLIEMY